MARPETLATKTCTAEIVPFPLARRRSFVERQARTIAGMRADAGERYLQRQLLVQFDALERKGVDCDAIYEQVRCLETAIRCALWRVVLLQEPR
jgi:hypothetical protein